MKNKLLDKLVCDNGVTLFYDRYGNIVDLTVPDDATYIDFIQYDSHSYNFFNVLLRNHFHQYPNITTLVLHKNIYDIDISNFTFPNVRNIASDGCRNFPGDTSMLMKGSSAPYVLYNTFCLKPDEVLDLSNVSSLSPYAMEGCLAEKVVNMNLSNVGTSHMAEVCFSGSSYAIQSFSDGFQILKAAENSDSDILLNIDVTEEELNLPDNEKPILYGVNNIDMSLVNHISIHKFDSLNCFIEMPQNLSILDTGIPSNLFIPGLFTKGYAYNNLQSIAITDDNPYYKTVDGIMYTKDKKQLIFYPSGRTGKFNIPDGVVKIGPSAFSHSCLQSLALSDSVRDIGQNAFYAMVNLDTFDFGHGICEIGYSSEPAYLFNGCDNLHSLHFPGNLKRIGNNAIAAKALTEVTFEEGIERIGDSVFYAYNNNEWISEFDLPSSLKSVGSRNFINAKKVTLHGSIPDGFFSSFLIHTISDDDLYEEFLTVIYRDKVFYLPKIQTSAFNNWLSYSACYNSPDVVFYDSLNFTIFDNLQTPEARQTMGLKLYSLTQDKNIRTYLRRVGKSFALRLLKKGRQEDLIELLKLNILTKNAMQKLSEAAKETDDVMMSAYILKAMNESDESKSTFRL